MDPTFSNHTDYVNWRISMTKQKSRARRDGRDFALMQITQQLARVKAAHRHLASASPAIRPPTS